MSVKLGANKDVTKDAKKDAIEVEKLGANKGVTLDTTKWAQKWTQKWMLKMTEKKDAIDGVLRKCTIAPGLASDCSPQLGKNYTKIRC